MDTVFDGVSVVLILTAVLVEANFLLFYDLSVDDGVDQPEKDFSGLVAAEGVVLAVVSDMLGTLEIHLQLLLALGDEGPHFEAAVFAFAYKLRSVGAARCSELVQR